MRSACAAAIRNASSCEASARRRRIYAIPGRLSPSTIDRHYQTLQGSELAVTGPTNHLWVNDALVLCGGITTTTNATLYLTDTALTPPPGW